MRVHRVQRELRQLKVTKNQYLEFLRNLVGGKSFGRPEMAAAGVIDQNIEVTGLGERRIEGALDGGRIAKIEAQRMEARQLR